MKKILYLLALTITLALFGCGTPATAPTPTVAPAFDQKVIDADNAKLKTEAVKADFVEINGHYDKVKARAVFAEGKITAVDYKNVMDLFPSFTLSQKEGDGYGMYHVRNVSDSKDLKDGDTVKVYGKIGEPNASGMPTIMCTVIEKK